MNKTCKRIIITNIVVLVLVAGFVLVTYLIRGKTGFGCAFHELTGLYCPGCGGTRAVYSMLRLNIIDAVRCNISVPFAIFVYIYYNIRGFIAGYRSDMEYFKRQKYPLCIVLAIVIVVNFILKNVLLLCFGIRFM